MFKVIDKTFDNNVMCTRILMKSVHEFDCWDMIAARLAHHDPMIREGAKNLLVEDAAGSFMNPPEFVLNLYRMERVVRFN